MRNAEFGMRNSVEFAGWRVELPHCAESERFSAPLIYKGSWILLPLCGNKRLRGSLSALLWGY